MVLKRRAAGAAILVGCAGLAASGRSAAQEAGPNPAIGPLEEITVTARRVAESQQSVPVSMTTLSDAILRQDTVLEAQDLQFHVPALQIDADAVIGGAQPNITIRGLSRVLGTDPPTVTYFAEVPQSTRGIVDAPTTWPMSRCCAGRRASPSARTRPAGRSSSGRNCRPTSSRAGSRAAGAITAIRTTRQC